MVGGGLMASEQTWLEQAKERRIALKKLFRDTGGKYPELEMLSIGDTNFLVTEKLAKLLVALEVSCIELRSGRKDDDDAWKWGSGFANLVKIHQLACGEPDNYRSQFLKAINASHPSEDAGKKKDGFLGL